MKVIKMNQALWPYLLLFLALVTLRAIDLYITYKITPDLSFEWNPLVTQMQLSWTGLLVTQLILVLFALLAYQRYAGRVRNPVDVPGLGLRRFVFYYFNGFDASWANWSKAIFRLPNRHYLKANGAFIGFVIICSYIAVSIFAIVHNLFILDGTSSYLDFVADNSQVYFLSVFISIVLTSANLFFMTEFKAYRRSEVRE